MTNMQPDTQIRGSLSVSRDVLAGNKATVKGDASVSGNLKVDGWLDAPNIKAPCRGLFADYEALVNAYPHPRPGEWALVGPALPARIYISTMHRWTDTGETGGEICVDLNYYDSMIARLRDATIRNADNIASLVAAGATGSIGGISGSGTSLVTDSQIETIQTSAADLILATEQAGEVVSFANGHIRTANFDSANIPASGGGAVSDHPVEVQQTADADLILAGEDGQPVLTVKAGRITTSAFDSANIQAQTPSSPGSAGPTVNITVNNVISQDRPLDGLKLSVLGDSISTYRGLVPSGYGTTYPYDDVQDVSKTWWKITADNLGMQLLKNCSWTGSTVSYRKGFGGAYSGSSDQRIADLADGSTTPDVIVMLIGINDWGLGMELGEFGKHSAAPSDSQRTFSEAYASAVIKAQTRYPAARVFCCTLYDVQTTGYSGVTTAYPRKNAAGCTVTDYNDKILEICRITGATPIDLHACGINHRTQHLYLFDALHPNSAGMALIARKVMAALQYS